MKTTHSPHVWQFFRCGGFDQVRIETADDLRHLASLDPKLWAVLACPAQGLEFDGPTLALLDARGEGQVRASDVLAAVQWTCRMLRDPGVLFEPDDGLTPEALNEQEPEAASLAQALRELRPAPAQADGADPSQTVTPTATQAVTLADLPALAERAVALSAQRPDGDGVVGLSQCPDAQTRDAVALIAQTLGPAHDGADEACIDTAHLERFVADARAVLAWHAQPRPAAAGLDPAAVPAALQALQAVQAKVEDHFTRCRLAAFDERAALALNPAEQTWAALAAEPALSVDDERVQVLPLAPVSPGAALPLAGAVNPAWEERLAALRRDAVQPVLGDCPALTREMWQRLVLALQAWQAWQAARPDTPVSALGVEALAPFVEGGLAERLGELIEKDRQGTSLVAALKPLERLLRYRAHLATLLRNFVNLADFYAPGDRAVFQAGTLYLDQRSCELCLRVRDLGRHAALAPLSGTFLVYCQCTRMGEEPFTLVAAMTGGDVDDMMVVGRNGVFYDRQGRDWSASVVRIVQNPISVRQAFWAPYKRLSRWVGEQLRKFAAAQDKAGADKAAAALGETGSQALKAPAAAKAGPAAPPAAKAAGAGPAAPATAPSAAPPSGFDIARYAGIFAAVGLALGALGTALAALAGTFLALPLWQMPLVIAGVALAISGPSMLLAWLKLRQRNLGPLLDANGWAVNIRARINLPFGATLTSVAALPPGARRSLVDPYADPPGWWRGQRVWWVLALLVTALAIWRLGPWR